LQIPTDGLIISIVGMDLVHWKLTKIEVKLWDLYYLFQPVVFWKFSSDSIGYLPHLCIVSVYKYRKVEKR
jgi:hypothetical protein